MIDITSIDWFVSEFHTENIFSLRWPSLLTKLFNRKTCEITK